MASRPSTSAAVSLADVDPSLREATKRVPPINLENRLVLALARRIGLLVRGKKVDGVERRLVRSRTVRSGDLKLRVYRPAKPSGAALLWIHGGGLVLGAAATDDKFCGIAARDTGATVVSVDYRLAPRHPFPTPLDDCYAAWEWLQQNLDSLGIDPGRVAIGGQSAGGGLAASLVQRVCDEKDDEKSDEKSDQRGAVAAQWLFCPMLDDRTAADRGRDAAAHFVWTNRSNLVGWSSYLGADSVGAAELPAYAAAARRQDLAGLPPTWIYTSDIELFHDEDADYARRLEAAGVDVTLVLVKGAPHGFESWASGSEKARELLAASREWLGRQLAA